MELHHPNDETFAHHAQHIHPAAHQMHMYQQQQQQHEAHIQQQQLDQPPAAPQQQMSNNHNQQRNNPALHNHSQQQSQQQQHLFRGPQMSRNHVQNTTANQHGPKHSVNNHNSNNNIVEQHNNPAIRQNRVGLNSQNRASAVNSSFHQQRFHSNHATQMNHQVMTTAGHHHSQHVNSSYMPRQGVQESDFPLRILVQSDMVGAIIGRSGSTIKQITQQSKAKIDVHREESVDQQEKVITINGSPESCSSACFKIIDVIQTEKSQMGKTNGSNLDDLSNAHYDNTASSSTSDIQLKILAHNNLIGRLIGKSGASIKRIMEQTSTKINISMNSLTDCTNERIITVVGNLEQVRQAEQVISTKLRAAYMSDVSNTLQAMNQHPYLFNNVPLTYVPGPYAQNQILSSLVGSQASHGHAMSRGMPVGPHQNQIPVAQLYPNSPNYLSLYSNVNVPPAAQGLLGFNPSMSGLDGDKETVSIYIPSSMVGAIIGKSGSAIKEMISTSGASIKVAAAPVLPEQVQAAQKDELPTEPVAQEHQAQDQKEQQEDNQEEESASGTSTGDVKQDENNTGEIKQDSPEQADESPQPAATASRHHNSDSHPPTRKVTITGSPESQRSAQYLIYRKVSIESGKSDISLMVEIQVPSQMVGKIIGKGGATVKNIQKHTRTTIRLSEEKQASSDTENEPETSVQITGEFNNSHLAQRHIRNLIRDSLYSTSRQNNKQNISSKHSQNNVGKLNAQDNNQNNNNNQNRSDNESTSTPDVTQVDETSSSRSNGKKLDVSSNQGDENPVPSESPPSSALDINGNPK